MRAESAESMKKSPHVIWVCPSSKAFYRTKGEVRCRPGSVIPRLSEKVIRVNVLIPHDSTLLPKTRLAPSRTTTHKITLSQTYEIEITKLTRGSVSPGVYMAKTPALEPALASAVFAKAAIALANQLRKPVDIFHLFNWESAMLPLFLELEKNGSKLFRETRTFLNVQSLRDQGNFAPAIMAYLGLPTTLFHPEGIEFFGKVSFLKSGLLFSDGVGLVEGAVPRNAAYKNGTGLEGVLDSLTYKLRRWASERSLRSHLDAYNELLNSPKPMPLLPRLMERLHQTREEVDSFVESWGPVPPERYGVNAISFLLQAPHKAYAVWEWSADGEGEFGLVLEDRTASTRQLLSRGLGAVGDYWIDIESDHEYVAELVGVSRSGQIRPLLRSRPLRSPRMSPSPNRDAVFIDVHSRKRFMMTGPTSWERLTALLRSGGTSAWEWVPEAAPLGVGAPSAADMPSSFTGSSYTGSSPLGSSFTDSLSTAGHPSTTAGAKAK
jgi:hypothetical protein